MRLKSIKLTNFRQFRGVQTLDLSSDSAHPVTLIFGANGAGKTTLLNAFTWALYGTMSDDVEEQNRLVTDSVWRDLAFGESAEVSVEVEFDHEGQSYRLLRGAEARKESDAQDSTHPTLKLWTTSLDGSSEASPAPQETISSILPVGVSRFFFFNGERIENLVKKGAYAEVKNDVKVLLDLEQVERAISHLPKVNRRFAEELKKHGGPTASAIQAAIDDLTERQTTAKAELSEIEFSIATLNEEVARIEQLLLEHAESAPLQVKRDAVSKDLDSERVDLEDALYARKQLIATRGFLAFTGKLAESTSQIADSLYQKGALPAPLKREFVDKLLESGECICGTGLEEHTDTWAHVHAWRQRAGLQAVETAWQRVSGQIIPLNDARADLGKNLGSLVSKIDQHRQRIEALEGEKSELDGKLKNSRKEEVQALESKRSDLLQKIQSEHSDKGGIKNELQNLIQQIEKKNKDRSRAEVTGALANKARSRSELVTAVKKTLEEILEIRENDMRLRLDSELKNVFETITHQAHVPALSDGFELTLHKNVNGVELSVAKSTGENQILSLSFVAAVSKLAREIRRESRAEGTAAEDAGTFPIVMDAAFGSLDQDYQQTVSRALAKMAPQLIVFVSKSQGLGRVVEELLPHVSHIGVIETYTSATGNVTDEIEINGSTYPYISQSETDYSELKAIR